MTDQPIDAGSQLAGNPRPDLQESRERLLAAIAGVSEEQFKRRPPVEHVATAGDWSIAEVLAHLLAAEQRACARVEALLRGDTPPPEVLSDEERAAEARLGRTVPVPQVIHGLLASRRRLERALAQAEQGQEGTDLKPRPYIAPEVESLVQGDVIEHEREHTAQIEAIKAVLPKRELGARPPPG